MCVFLILQARIAKEGSHTKAVAPQFVTDARFGERSTSHDDAHAYMAQQEEMDEMQGPKWRAKMAARADAEKMAWEARRAAGGKDGKDGKPAPITRSADVPLGNGMADAAKTSILSRRERIRASLEDSGA